MAKKTGGRKMPAGTEKIKHARIELPDRDYEAVREMAKANGLSIAAYIRQAVLQRVRRDKSEVGGT